MASPWSTVAARYRTTAFLACPPEPKWAELFTFWRPLYRKTPSAKVTVTHFDIRIDSQPVVPFQRHTAYGTRPYNGAFAFAAWFWGTFAGFCVAGAVKVTEEPLKWLVNRSRDHPWWEPSSGHRRLDLSWRWVGALLAASALVAWVGSGCVRNEPYRKDFVADPTERTFTVEEHRLAGLTSRVFAFDDVDRLRYHRGPRGENTQGSSDVHWVLRSGESIKLMSGWPKFAYEFAEAMVWGTGWNSECTGRNSQCRWEPP
jgi:hypothetical protein